MDRLLEEVSRNNGHGSSHVPSGNNKIYKKFEIWNANCSLGFFDGFLVLNFFYENVGKVVGSNGRGTGGNNGTWVRRNGKWVQEESAIDEPPVRNV